jgi:hypothetical protein
MPSKPSIAAQVTPHVFMGDGPACATCGLSSTSRVHTPEARAEFAKDPRRYEFQMGRTAPSRTALSGASRSLKTETARQEPVQPTPVHVVEHAFITQVGEKTILTARAEVITDPDQLPREMAAKYSSNKHFLWVQGNYVEAGKPNGNGAFWTTEDLEMGEPTVQYGPVNMLHQERHIIGAIADAHLYREAAGQNAHIKSQAAIWKFLYPGESRAIEKASAEGHLWQSMECQAETIICQTSADGSRQGCGREYAWDDYAAYLTGTGGASVCNHIRERSSQRRFAQPSFLGTAIVLPPARPAWGAAEAQVLKEAATVIEGMDVLPNLPDAELESLIAQVVAYGKDA